MIPRFVQDMSTEVFYLCGSIATLLTAVIVQLLVRLCIGRKGASKYPPMAPYGMLETLQKVSGDDFPWFLLRTAETLGTRTFRLPLPIPGPPMVVAVGDPALARDILNDKDTIKPRSMYGTFDDATNGISSIFTTNGSFWHGRRKGIAPAFAANQVNRMNAVALEAADEWIEGKLRPTANKNEGFNIANEMVDLLLSSIARTAFEYTLSQTEIDMFKYELDLAMKEFCLKTSTNPLRKVFGVFIKERRRAHLASKRLHEICLKIVRRYRTLPNPTKGTIIDLIMNNPCYEDDHQRAADVQLLFIGGHDTTAYTLAWILKELALNPKMQSQLRQDLATDTSGKANNNSTLKKFIREGIRLHPVSAGGSIRQVGRNFATADGKLIPKGSITFIPFILPLRDPNIFGNTVDEFDPYRWDCCTQEMNQAFLPFSTGKQNCVGQSLANAELQSILPRIISQFALTLESPGTTAFFLTLKPVDAILKAKPLGS